MRVHTAGYPVTVSRELVEILEHTVKQSGKNISHGVYVIFRDNSYTAETGGYHPVEIMISANGNIQYITDFAYVGYPPELAKEIDFDFSEGHLFHMGSLFPMDNAKGLFRLWQSNFCSYYKAGVYEVIVREVN